MYLMLDTNGAIFQRKEISGWSNVPTALTYTDATMIYDGSILAISNAGQLHLLATLSGPAQDMAHNLPHQPHSVAALLDGSVLVLTGNNELFRANFPRGPWTQLTLPALPPPVVPTDIASLAFVADLTPETERRAKWPTQFHSSTC